MPTAVNPPRTLYDKIWDDHVVTQKADGLALIYIDRHLVHEVTSPQAFEGLRSAGRPVRRTDCTLATVDHNVPTVSRKNFVSVTDFIAEPDSRAQCAALEENVKEFGLTYFGMKDRRQGIVHVIGPEQGFTLPGITCVCGDSHTSTHGAFGSLAFGIGTSEVEHVLATQTLLQKKAKNMRISVDGELHEGVTSKDVILHIIGVIGTAGGTGCVIEYAGSVFRGFSMEARMSVCNMSIEAGARAGMVAPDEITFEYLKDRPLAPKGEEWDRAVDYWRTLKTDDGAKFDIEVNINASDIVPTVTWGTSPQDVVPIVGKVPDPSIMTDAVKRSSAERSLAYMGLTPDTPMEDITIDKVFIGSCTNSRVEDLRSAARIVLAAGPDAKVAPNVHAMIVPGSGLVKEQSEAEGLDVIFKRAGFDWREAGCSMCLGMNPDQLAPGERCASTSNRNFEGRQGAGGRTHLLSPAMAAAAALNGKLTDVRKYFGATAEANIAAAPKLKVHRPSEFWDEPSTPPEPVTHTGAGGLPPSESPSPVQKFTVVKGVCAPLHIENVDTDMIIPKQFLKTLKRTGLANALFYTLRKDPHTGQDTDFILNREPYTRSKILVCTGKNFGCGSSREHAPWSLNDFGIRCIIAPSFADIFRNNSMQNGMLPVALPQEQCKVLAKDAEEELEIEVDLVNEVIRRANGEEIPFSTDPFRRHCLVHGLDDIALTLQAGDAIETFEKRRSEQWSWLDGFGYKGKKIPVQTTTQGGSKTDCLTSSSTMSTTQVVRAANPPAVSQTSSDPGSSNRLQKKGTPPLATFPPSSKNAAQSLQSKKMHRKSSKPILTWFQRKLGGSVKAKRTDSGSFPIADLGLGRSSHNPPRVGERAASSPLPQAALSNAARQSAKRESGVRRTAFSLNEEEDTSEEPLSFDDNTSIDRSSYARDSLWSPTSALEADDDASLRPIPPSAPPSPSPSRSSSSYLSDPRTFRSMTASTKPTTILSIDLGGNGMAHIAQVPPNAPANPVHRIAPHIRHSSSLNTPAHLNTPNSITFSALPSSPQASSRPPSVRHPGSISSLNFNQAGAYGAATAGHVQAPLHTAPHPRNNPRPSSPPLDNASMLTLASSAYAHPGRTGLHAYSIATTVLGDNASHYGESVAFPDGESTSQFLLGDDDRLEERDIDASVRALRPRSSRRGSWESEVSRWSARVQLGPGTPSLVRQQSLWTSNSVRTGAFSSEYRHGDDDEEYDNDKREKLDDIQQPLSQADKGSIKDDSLAGERRTLEIATEEHDGGQLHKPSMETIAQTAPTTAAEASEVKNSLNPTLPEASEKLTV